VVINTISFVFSLIVINIIIASLGVVLIPRIIYSALSLAFVLINIALLYLLLNFAFLASTQILIYVGAINILIVFAIMLVNIPSIENFTRKWNSLTIISAIFTTLLFCILLLSIYKTSFTQTIAVNQSIDTIKEIGITLLSDFLIPFELLSLLLLIGLVGAINIARKPFSLK
jgi:NAD(P)H-quinone oxidoreductase subunit 6